jgi:sterol desaturase/sphingolipid hydroxylase (fatty acid hydroxylase superfamily)
MARRLWSWFKLNICIGLIPAAISKIVYCLSKGAYESEYTLEFLFLALVICASTLDDVFKTLIDKEDRLNKLNFFFKASKRIFKFVVSSSFIAYILVYFMIATNEIVGYQVYIDSKDILPMSIISAIFCGVWGFIVQIFIGKVEKKCTL